MPNGTEIAKAYVQIIPSAQGIKGNIEKELSGEMASAGTSSGSLLGKELVGTLQKVIAAAGIGKILKDALDEGAKLQQSYGGLETIYGDAAGAVKNFAMLASQAGISANDYAEQAVSFGASLKQAFGGDTVKAAQAANTAILDMTDNAAKMGTPIESIQNAYQGFAKQNYTMLDNLKLGYGGTQKEMERLLADATKLTGVKYDIKNLGDVYEAIHVIQEDLGLTGVAATEAAETFSGSFNAMKASVANLLGALATGQPIDFALQSLITNVGNFLQGNLIPMLGNIFTALPAVVQAAVPALIDAVQAMITSVTETVNPEMLTAGFNAMTEYVGGLMDSLPAVIEAGGEIITGLIETIGANAPQFIEQAGQMLSDFVGTILSKLPDALDAGTKVVSELATGALKTVPKVIEAAGKAIADFLQTVLSNLPKIVDSGIQLLTSWAAGMNKNSQAAIFAIYNAIKQILATIVQNLPQILEAGVKILATLASGLVRQIPYVISTVAGLIGDIVKSFINYDWGSLGKAIIEGIANGLKNAGGILIEAGKNAALDAFNGAKKLLKIGSPSKLFRDEIGAMMAEGMAIGFEENVPTAEIEHALQPMASVVPDTIGGSQYSYGGFTINVYGAPGQSVQELADIVSDRINHSIRSRQAVFA